MCNRYRMTAAQIELAKRYGVEPIYPEDATFPPPELFPKREAWVVRGNLDLGDELAVMRWGFPHTITGPSGKKIEKAVTNVRNLTSQFWRSALKNPIHRCLVPVTSFSEYGPGPVGAKPLYWFDVPSRPIFSFAGIWRPTPDGLVFAFLTCEPNSVVAPIHPKAMPVILHDEDEERWLRAPVEEALELVSPYPAQLMSVEDAANTKGVDAVR